MEALSERYGWTPEEIRNMRVTDVNQYLEIMGEISRIEKYEKRKNG